MAHLNKMTKQRLKRREQTDFLIKYKGGECQVCGYSKSKQALEFHHVNPEEKEFKISGNTNGNLSRLIKEVDKCVLLCANCHREVHDGSLNLDDYIGDTHEKEKESKEER